MKKLTRGSCAFVVFYTLTLAAVLLIAKIFHWI